VASSKHLIIRWLVEGEIPYERFTPKIDWNRRFVSRKFVWIAALRPVRFINVLDNRVISIYGDFFRVCHTKHSRVQICKIYHLKSWIQLGLQTNFLPIVIGWSYLIAFKHNTFIKMNVNIRHFKTTYMKWRINVASLPHNWNQKSETISKM
jgi:hypothetical protein